MAKERTIRRRLARLHAHLGRLESLARDDRTLAEKRPERSGWSVGEHVEHLLIVDLGVVKVIDKILEGKHDGAGDPSPGGRLALATGRILRGVGKAPEPVQPRGRDPQAVRELAAEVRDRLDRLGARTAELAAATGTRKHPFFGSLTPARWLRFAIIHDHHHLRIVDHIRR